MAPFLAPFISNRIEHTERLDNISCLARKQGIQALRSVRAPKSCRHKQPPPRLNDDTCTPHGTSRSRVQRSSSTVAVSSPEYIEEPLICFPGGGIFYFWQSGVAHYLSQNYDLSSIQMVGTSAGALTAVLAGSGVDMPCAMKTAFDLSKEAALFDRPLGVLGVWGPLIHQWLEVLLPDDAAIRCRNRVHVMVLKLRRIVPVALPVFAMSQRVMVQDFQNKSELIASCMASVHIPWIIDGSATTKLRGFDCIDGSIGGAREYVKDCFPKRPKIWLDPEDDPAMVGRRAQLLSLTGGDQNDEGLEKAERAWNWVSQMMSSGYAHAKRLDEEGQFDLLSAYHL